MNNKIKELADEAGFMDSWFSESGDDCERELKKFADLIVKEVIAEFYDEIQYQFSTAYAQEITDSAKRRFGVK